MWKGFEIIGVHEVRALQLLLVCDIPFSVFTLFSSNICYSHFRLGILETLVNS